MHSHGEMKLTSGAVDLANADATTNANKANAARLTVAFFNRPVGYGKELKASSAPESCGTAFLIAGRQMIRP